MSSNLKLPNYPPRQHRLLEKPILKNAALSAEQMNERKNVDPPLSTYKTLTELEHKTGCTRITALNGASCPNI